MTKLVVLKLDGDLEQGVRVTLTMVQEGDRLGTEVTGNLPPNPNLAKKSQQWQRDYHRLDRSTRIKGLEVKIDVEMISTDQRRSNCERSSKDLLCDFNQWLLSESFRPIRDLCLQQFTHSTEVRLLIRTASWSLLELPWELWDLVEQNPHVQVTFCAPDFHGRTEAKEPTLRGSVKILAILGDNTDIDRGVEHDEQVLKDLPDVEPTFLRQPNRQVFDDSLWQQSWDILFFAGHSNTEGEQGRIKINKTDYLTIAELKNALRKAVGNGLQVAIFNSCDGMRLAMELQKLHIPQIVVMRELVPDPVAERFLPYFLSAYASGKSLDLAVREARERLQGLENEFLCASWLPRIFQNPAAGSPSWQQLGWRPSNKCPYRGLFAFREEDAQFFFGRESFTQMLVEAVQSQPLVAVIGPSGSGKSSVVFAGLVKRLRDAGNWQIVDFRPGSRPLFALASALVSQNEARLNRTKRLREIRNLTSDLGQCENGLRDVVDDIHMVDNSKRLLLVADQFEELYTLCRDPLERRAFLDRLIEAINNCRNFTCVITLRADFLEQALSYRPFADALQYADLKLGPMTEEELLAAVEKPAALLGVTIEQGLTAHILSALSAEPGDLPLLEFALTQLWPKQINAQLTYAAYDQIGGVEAALARCADEAYNQLNFEEKERAQRIFIQLVYPGEGMDTRRVATRAEVGEENWDLVTRLASSRLVVTGRDEKTGLETVEIVHEALIRNWLQLYLWIELDREFRRWQEQFRADMRTWESNGYDEGYLLPEKPLRDAEDWQSQRFLELSAPERSFISLSRELRSQQSKKQKRRQQLFISWLIGSLVVTLMLLGIALWQTYKARINEITSTSATSEALFASNQELEGLTTAIGAGEQLRKLPWVTTDTQTTVINALQNVLDRIKEYNRLEGDIIKAQAVPLGSDGGMIATWSKQKTVKLWKPDGTELNTPWLNNLKDVSAVAFSPKDQIIATASHNTVTLWNNEGQPKLTLTLPKQEADPKQEAEVSHIAFSYDSQRIVTVSRKKNFAAIQLWNADGFLIKTLYDRRDANPDFQMAVTFSPDGNTIAAGGWHGQLRLWNKDGTSLNDIQFGLGCINAISFSPNSQMIVIGYENGKISLHKSDGSEFKKDFAKHSGSVWGISFSPDGQMIASASDDKTVKIWNPDNGSLVTTLKGHGSGVDAVAFSPDSQTIASASDDGSVKLWKPTATPLRALEHESKVFAVGFSPDANKIATTYGQGFVSLWKPNGMLLKTEKWHNGEFSTLVFSPNNQLIVTAAWDREVHLMNTDGRRLKTLEGHTGESKLAVVVGASFSPDSQMFVLGDTKGKIELWNSEGKLLEALQRQGSRVLAVSFSSHKMIAAASQDGMVKFWKPDGKLQNSFRVDGDLTRVAFSSDGKIIATVSKDQMVKLWKSDGKLLKNLPRHHDTEISALAFSPDGKILVTGNTDKTVNLWKSDGTFVKTITNLSGVVSTAAFSPNGKTLALASLQDGTVILRDPERDLNLDELLKLGCDWGSNYLQTNPKVSESDRDLCK